MTCREFITFLHRYLDNELEASERNTFDQHLSVCEACRNFMDSYKTTRQLASLALSSDSGSIPKEVPEDLVAAVLAATR